MKSKFIYLSIMLAVTALILSSTKAFAYRGDPTVKGPNYTEERHEAMLKAFENNDYNSWKSLMRGRGRVSQVINESNFPKFSQAHRLMLEGNIEEAKKIRNELGLGLNSTTGKGLGQNMNGNCRYGN